MNGVLKEKGEKKEKEFICVCVVVSHRDYVIKWHLVVSKLRHE